MPTALKVHLKNINGDQLHPYTTNVPIGQQFSFQNNKLQLEYDVIKANLGISSDSFSFSIPEQTFTAAPDNQLILSGLPVGIKTNKGNYYPIQKATVTFTGTSIVLNLQNYLTYDNSPSFSGPWTVYYASGRNGTDGLTPYIDSQTKNWVIGDTDTGVCADVLLAGSTVVISSAQDDIALIQGSNVPVGVLTDKGNYYPVQKNSITINAAQNQIQLDLSPYLAYDNSASFSGTWTVYFAAGTQGEQGNNALSFQIGTVTTLPAGSDATVSATVSEEGLVTLNMGIPQGDPGQDGTNTTVVCLCAQQPEALFDGMIWVKGGTSTPVYYNAVGGVTVLTEMPSDVTSQSNGTIVILEA